MDTACKENERQEYKTVFTIALKNTITGCTSTDTPQINNVKYRLNK